MKTATSFACAFANVGSAAALEPVYPRALALGSALNLPLVTAELSIEVGDTDISFGPEATKLGSGQITGSIVSHCTNGFVFQ